MNSRSLTPSAAALSVLSLGLAAPAAAQNITHAPDPATVDIMVEVQEIAVLSVVDGSASTIMDDPNPTSVGDPNSVQPTPGMAQLELATNFCVGLEFDFPTTVGIRPNPLEYYGVAEGVNNQNTLGVQPFVRVANNAFSFGDVFNLTGSDTDAPLMVSSGSGGGLCDGYYDIFIGLVTQWDLTLNGEPMFAEPDTYRIPITVSLVP